MRESIERGKIIDISTERLSEGTPLRVYPRSGSVYKNPFHCMVIGHRESRIDSMGKPDRHVIVTEIAANPRGERWITPDQPRTWSLAPATEVEILSWQILNRSIPLYSGSY